VDITERRKSMTNGEKFKTAEERTEGFIGFCTEFESCIGCPLYSRNHPRDCSFAWLDFEYKEELKPCPFCDGEAKVIEARSAGVNYYLVECTKCFGRTVSYLKQEEAIAAWNRRV
jgi:Lar family restriction alleviation protein